MKYVKLESGDKIIAISNDISLLATYICHRRLNRFNINKINKKTCINDDLLLREYKGYVMTNLDIKIFNKMKNESSVIYTDGVRLINEIIKSGDISNKENRILNRAMQIIENCSKKNILGTNKTDAELIYMIINMKDDEKELVLRNY